MADNLDLSPQTVALLTAVSELVDSATTRGLMHEYHLKNPINAVLQASSIALPQCTLDTPTTAIVAAICARTGNMRLECSHTSQHCWDLHGVRTGC
ncbi:MAG TPA: hypothetical protein VGZ02_05505 [Candidatus Baltobacteraceae bacterium]|jgi:hypothetical protein|nr:hypothetical protein [Candidatus Baltobacteraceae bacterium]